MAEAAEQPASPVQGQVLTFRVAGSSVVDANGAGVGNIEALSIDPQSGQVTFAMVSLGFPNERTRVTPIPWQLIQHRSDARGAEVFRAHSSSSPSHFTSDAAECAAD
jgi:sporulation protein YlmC with PRC-barrel domain